ncbi:CUB domain-containing protein [Eleutherodactylus coqui]|uniref:CUB domain-containing protein n=1 Tax=Eleutherodactylus coqui TaxID=57060 RepID=UPI0034634FF4
MTNFAPQFKNCFKLTMSFWDPKIILFLLNLRAIFALFNTASESTHQVESNALLTYSSVNMEILTIVLIFAHLTLNLPSVTVAQPTTVTANSCGGTWTETSGYIYGYWQDSASNPCTWTIMVPNDSIYVYFNDVEMQNSGGDCNSEYVTVYDGYPSDSSVLGTVCQNTRQSFYSSSSVMTLVLVHQNSPGHFAVWYDSFTPAPTTAYDTTTLAPTTAYDTTTLAPTTACK